MPHRDVAREDLTPPAAFCSRCGEPLETHERCDRADRPGTPFDPPRFCGDCGAKLAIQVEPAGYTARCRRCERRRAA